MRFKIPKIVQKLSLNIQKFNCERHVYDYNLADTPNHSSKKECSFSFRKRKLFKLKIPLYAAPVTSKRSSSDGTIVDINYSYSTAFDIPKSNLTDRKLSWPRVETSSCCSQTTVHPVSAKESQEYFFCGLLIVKKDYQAVGKKARPLLRHGLLSKTIVAEFISHVPLYEGDKN